MRTAGGPGPVKLLFGLVLRHRPPLVPDGFTHAMLLRRGTVLTAGPIDEVFTAKNLSRCFGVPLEIERHENRWRAWAR